MKKFLTLLFMAVTITCGALCITACSGGKEYSVACQSAENGYVTVADASVKAGKKVILAAHPNVGYKLTSFLVDGEEIDGCSLIMPEKNITVSAQFEPVTYSVTYVLGDATLTGTNPSSYTVESAGELTAPEKDGYEICGWYRYYTEAENDYEWDMEDYRVTSLKGLFGNLTLYAKYYNPLHEIHFDYDENGWGYVEDGLWEARYGDTVSVVADPHTGYELDCVCVNGEAIDGTSFTMPACDVEIFMKFKPIIYTISYELDGGTNAPDNPTEYTVDDGQDGYITLEDAQKEGYVFICWYYFDGEYEQWLYNSTFSVYECQSVTFYAYFIEEDEESE